MNGRLSLLFALLLGRPGCASFQAAPYQQVSLGMWPVGMAISTRKLRLAFT
jgi:hypothetical protein